MLKFNGAWRFHTPASIDQRVVHEFSVLIGKIAAQGSLQPILEHFKSYFASASGTTSSWSSSASWAETDLHSYIHVHGRTTNIPEFEINTLVNRCGFKFLAANSKTSRTALLSVLVAVIRRRLLGIRGQPRAIIQLSSIFLRYSGQRAMLIASAL